VRSGTVSPRPDWLLGHSYDWTLSAITKALGPVPFAALEPQRIRALFERSAPSIAGRLYELLRITTRWARRRGLVEADPMAGVGRPGPRPRRDRVLSEGDLRRLLGEIRRRPSRTRLGLKLVLLTAARPGEVFGATFEEFAEERGGVSPGWWWTLPVARSKTGVAVRRPLSPQAAVIVEELRLLGGTTLIEPPRGRSPIAMRVRWAVSLRKLAVKAGVADLRAHDLRRTAATMLARLGVRFEVIETLLGHALPGVSGVYIRHSYDAEMRAALELLGEEVDRL
jgi:integrase